MQTLQKTTQLVVLLTAIIGLSACNTTPMNKQEADARYGQHKSAVRWVGYQGSDAQFHHFIARVMDEWAFIRITRAELKVEDQRPFSRASTAPLSYYLVDPSRNYEKIVTKGRKPNGAANHPEVSAPQVIPEGTYASLFLKLTLNEDGTYIAEDLTQPTVVWMMEGNRSYPERAKKLPPETGKWICDSATGDITLSPATGGSFFMDLSQLPLRFHIEDPIHLFINPQKLAAVPNALTQELPFLTRQ